MTKIWEVITIQYKKAHPKENLSLIDDTETITDMDQSRAESIRAQKRARERIQRKLEEKNKFNQLVK
jgi:formiminotetrahydrofolate cyclodeaminase